MWAPCQHAWHSALHSSTPFKRNHSLTNKKKGGGGNPINPFTLILPHTKIVRSCSGISCIKSHVTRSTASAVLGIYQASSDKTVKEELILLSWPNLRIQLQQFSPLAGSCGCIHELLLYQMISVSDILWQFVLNILKPQSPHPKFYDHCIHDEDHAHDFKQFHVTSLRKHSTQRYIFLFSKHPLN